MRLSTWLILGLVLVGGVVWCFEEYRQKKKKLNAAFSGRTSLTLDDFYTTYFSNSGFKHDVVCKIKEIFERNLDADLSKLSADDDFSKNLKFIWKYDSLADVQIIIDLEKEFNIRITDAEAEKMTTIRKVVEVVHEKFKRS